MTPIDIRGDLENLSAETLEDDQGVLVEKWETFHAGFGAIEPVLRFMETHPDWDFGMPGPFVHFVEEYYRKGYEELLVASIRRRPTSHTTWMLNRVINGEQDSLKRDFYLKEMAEAAKHDLADVETRTSVSDFLRDL